jgi:hypothetical protein
MAGPLAWRVDEEEGLKAVQGWLEKRARKARMEARMLRHAIRRFEEIAYPKVDRPKK